NGRHQTAPAIGGGEMGLRKKHQRLQLARLQIAVLGAGALEEPDRDIEAGSGNRNGRGRGGSGHRPVIAPFGQRAVNACGNRLRSGGIPAGRVARTPANVYLLKTDVGSTEQGETAMD